MSGSQQTPSLQKNLDFYKNSLTQAEGAIDDICDKAS